MSARIRLRTPGSLLLVVLVALLVGCGKKPAATEATTQQSEPPKPPGPPVKPPDKQPNKPSDPPDEMLTAKPDVSLSLAEFKREWEKSGNAFITKYSGKILEVSGVVRDIECSTGIGSLILGSEFVKLAVKENNPFEKVLPEQTVTLRGRCGESGIPKWTIVAVKGDKPPLYDAEQLAKSFAEDEAGTAKKIGTGYVMLQGTVRKLEDRGGTVYLTPPDQKSVIVCSLTNFHQGEAQKKKLVEVGKKVTIIGQSSGRGSFNLCAVLPSNP